MEFILGSTHCAVAVALTCHTHTHTPRPPPSCSSTSHNNKCNKNKIERTTKNYLTKALPLWWDKTEFYIVCVRSQGGALRFALLNTCTSPCVLLRHVCFRQQSPVEPTALPAPIWPTACHTVRFLTDTTQGFVRAEGRNSNVTHAVMT